MIGFVFFLAEPFQLALIGLETGRRALRFPITKLFVLALLLALPVLGFLMGNITLAVLAKVFILIVFSQLVNEVKLPISFVLVALSLSCFVCIEQLLLGQDSSLAKFSSQMGYTNGHFPNLYSRAGGFQFSPNYMAMTILAGLILSRRHGMTFKTGPILTTVSCGAFLLGASAIVMSGSKTIIATLPFLIRRFSPSLLLFIGGLATLVVAYRFNVIENWKNFGANQFTISNRVDGYHYAFDVQSFLEFLFGRGTLDYGSAFDSTWSLAFASGGVVGLSVASYLAYLIVKRLYQIRLGGLGLALFGVSLFHPIFFHSVVTPLLLLSTYSKIRPFKLVEQSRTAGTY